MNIVNAILEDHGRMRALLDEMGPGTGSLRQRKQAFRQLQELFRALSKAKLKTAYTLARKVKGDLKRQALEQREELEAAELLIRRIEKAESGELWTARAKVLRDFLGHYLEDEERSFLPELDAALGETESGNLLRRYRSLIPAEGEENGKARVIRLPLRRNLSPEEARIP